MGGAQRVIVGDGHEMGPPTTVDTAFDPTSYSHLKAGTYPDPDRVAVQLAHLFDILAHEGVEVLNPDPIPRVGAGLFPRCGVGHRGLGSTAR